MKNLSACGGSKFETETSHLRLRPDGTLTRVEPTEAPEIEKK